MLREAFECKPLVDEIPNHPFPGFQSAVSRFPNQPFPGFRFSRRVLRCGRYGFRCLRQPTSPHVGGGYFQSFLGSITTCPRHPSAPHPTPVLMRLLIRSCCIARVPDVQLQMRPVSDMHFLIRAGPAWWLMIAAGF